MGAAVSTPDGKHLWVGGNIPSILEDARRAGNSRIVIHVTHDNLDYRNPSDSTFLMAKWKSDFDLVAGYGDAMRQYVKDGTLIGHYAIDEPFIDFHRFQAADLEEM